ncbi:MAG TPA: PRC-barrel domain-containing protein [Roseimicrobium sp.]|nr:PRC-barrel domain-containing protein [Roseimicrobium sp.]
MKSKFKFFALSVLAGCFLSVAQAEREPDPARLGSEKESVPVKYIQVENLKGEHLGTFKDVVIDLNNGRIVEVLVRSGGFMGIGGRIIAVPPAAFSEGVSKKVYRLDMTQAQFKAAPHIDVSEWTDSGRSRRVAAAYRYFGQEPYFLEEGARPVATEARSKVVLGYVERSYKMLDLPVRNRQGEELGSVQSVGFDLMTGRVLNVIVKAPGFNGERSVIPAMALRFNDVRNGLVLDDTEAEFAAEPRVALIPAGNGQPAYSSEESYAGPRTATVLEQGKSYRDLDRTASIKKGIRAAKLQSYGVEVGTINGRVTLRGQVKTEAERTLIGDIAIHASRVELVDNQIITGEPAAR